MGEPTVPEVLPLVAAYRDMPGNGVGGNFHIVLDEGNVTDEDVAYCLNRARENGDSAGIIDTLVDHNSELQQKCDAIAAELDRLRSGLDTSDAAALKHPEEICERCGNENVPGWYAPNDLWNRVVGCPNGILCPQCFVQQAEAAGERGPWLLTSEYVDYRSVRGLLLPAGDGEGGGK